MPDAVALPSPSASSTRQQPARPTRRAKQGARAVMAAAAAAEVRGTLPLCMCGHVRVGMLLA